MSVLKKLFTAIRGGVREAGEAVVDANSIRIFEQEIEDAKNDLAKAKRDLTEVMAKEMQAARKAGAAGKDVTKYEGYAAQALQKGDEGLALDIAGKIAEIQAECDMQKKAQASFASHAERLKGMIRKTTKGLTDMQRQLVMVKTTQSVQKATQAITNNYASGTSRLLSAKESLDRIERRQEDFEDRLKAGEQLEDSFSGQDLEEKMQAAGILESGDKAQDILAKLKQKAEKA